ncbi:hypothetical protein KVP10_01035 [Candidimonas humi]|jgi:hypothetical protein|uniref:Peptidase S74 domain-containing protein n=1 Tax=Candidimonas humi TaxID=683355 RepID=A0ABV8NTR7_9BURK|nr:hypothetical protein [Candidimonas humi]MBV6303445.1 hypothetical protein [Candidimonas humi]
MQNPDDYKAGWTTQALNPKTGELRSGGAARNMKTAQRGGVAAPENDATMQAFLYIQPLVDSLQARLGESMKLNQQLAQLVTTQQRREKSR